MLSYLQSGCTEERLATKSEVSLNEGFITLVRLQVERYHLLEKLEPYPLKVRLVEQSDILASLTAGEMKMLVDLRPFMQRTPFILQVYFQVGKAGHLQKCLASFSGSCLLQSFDLQGRGMSPSCVCRVTRVWHGLIGCSGQWDCTIC